MGSQENVEEAGDIIVEDDKLKSCWPGTVKGSRRTLKKVTFWCLNVWSVLATERTELQRNSEKEQTSRHEYRNAFLVFSIKQLLKISSI